LSDGTTSTSIEWTTSGMSSRDPGKADDVGKAEVDSQLLHPLQPAEVLDRRFAADC